MGRWTPDEHGCIYDEAGCFARLTPNKAERLASRHNADIDALTAERDEWKEIAQGEVETNVELRGKLAELQRRLDAIKAHILGNNMLSIGQLIAIAEGREE